MCSKLIVASRMGIWGPWGHQQVWAPDFLRAGGAEASKCEVYNFLFPEQHTQKPQSLQQFVFMCIGLPVVLLLNLFVRRFLTRLCMDAARLFWAGRAAKELQPRSVVH